MFGDDHGKVTYAIDESKLPGSRTHIETTAKYIGGVDAVKDLSLKQCTDVLQLLKNTGYATNPDFRGDDNPRDLLAGRSKINNMNESARHVKLRLAKALTKHGMALPHWAVEIETEQAKMQQAHVKAAATKHEQFMKDTMYSPGGKRKLQDYLRMEESVSSNGLSPSFEAKRSRIACNLRSPLSHIQPSARSAQLYALSPHLSTSINMEGIFENQSQVSNLSTGSHNNPRLPLQTIDEIESNKK